MSSCYNIEQFSSVGLLLTTYQNDPQICHERITLKSTKIFTYSDNQMRQIIYNGLEDCNCNTIGGTSFS
jgi:D-lyxose ketol-isomerase